MDFSIVIVSWNVKDKLRDNLKSILASSGASFEIIVVDNASSDGTADLVRNEFPQVQLIANSVNLGFAKACNQALALAKGSYLLLLNPDMKLEPTTLSNCLNWLKNEPRAAISGIKLKDSQGENIAQVRRFPRLGDQLAIVLKLAHLAPALLNNYLRRDFDYAKAQVVDSIRGAFFIIRRSTFEKLGPLDERYFLWFEEVDYCRRAKEAGLEVWYTPAAEAIDYVGQSFNQVKRSVKQGYFRASMIAYFKKWQPAWEATLIEIAWDFSEGIMAIADLFNLKARTKT